MTSAGQAGGYGHGPTGKYEADDGGSRRGAGPTRLIVVGAVATVLAVAIGVFGVVTTVRAVPTGVLTLSGQPGEDVRAVIDAPGSAEAVLDADVRYSLLVVGRSAEPRARLDGNVTVVEPDGSERELRRGASESFTLSSGGRTAHLSTDFRTTSAGTHAIVVPEADAPDAQVFLATLPSTGAFVAGIFGGVVGIVVAVLLGIAGVGMLVGGLVWRALRKPSGPPTQAHVAPPLH
ncbi:MAG: hypothetical protein GX593_07570 [Actinomycetales bacterium]|nr:hypothetical protein [Actinomycetales bacterium]